MKLPATMRLNNPGGMKWASWQRAYGGTPGLRSPGGDYYVSFPTAADGFAAAVALQQQYEQKGRTSIAQRVAQWTGYKSGGKDTASKQQYLAYTQALSRALGIPVDQPFSINDPNLGPKFLSTMAQVEAGRARPFAPADVQAGFQKGIAGQPSLPPAAIPNPTSTTLRTGMSDRSTSGAVSALQQQLQAAGFNPGKIDGVYGPRTAAAVRQAEAAYGLTPDKGIAGPQVQAALAGSPARDIADTLTRFPGIGQGESLAPRVPPSSVAVSGPGGMPWDTAYTPPPIDAGKVNDPIANALNRATWGMPISRQAPRGDLEQAGKIPPITAGPMADIASPLSGGDARRMPIGILGDPPTAPGGFEGAPAPVASISPSSRMPVSPISGLPRLPVPSTVALSGDAAIQSGRAAPIGRVSANLTPAETYPEGSIGGTLDRFGEWSGLGRLGTGLGELVGGGPAPAAAARTSPVTQGSRFDDLFGFPSGGVPAYARGYVGTPEEDNTYNPGKAAFGLKPKSDVFPPGPQSYYTPPTPAPRFVNFASAAPISGGGMTDFLPGNPASDLVNYYAPSPLTPGGPGYTTGGPGTPGSIPFSGGAAPLSPQASGAASLSAPRAVPPTQLPMTKPAPPGGTTGGRWGDFTGNRSNAVYSASLPYANAGTTPWGSSFFSMPGGGFSNSPFTPTGWSPPNFNPISGGPSYAYQSNGMGGGTFITSDGRVMSY